MNPHLLIAAIIAAIGFGSGWHLQTLRYTAKEADHEQQKLVQIQQSAAVSIRQADNVIAAQNAANTRAVALRTDRDRAYSELERLRDTLRNMPGASATGDAYPVTVDPARQLLLACAAELVEMGGIADRHASDALTLQQAWPK